VDVSNCEPSGGPEADLLATYDRALPAVYGYLLTRCHSQSTAEDLTAETFLAAVDAVRRSTPDVTIGWLIGIARHKLADHWRTLSREEARQAALAHERSNPGVRGDDDPWQRQLDRLTAAEVLDLLAPQHRLALTLRYVDDLPVAQVAEVIGRSLHATEGLLVRARQAFRRHYERIESDEGGAR